MSQQEPTHSWTLRDGMPLSGDPELDALHARVLTEEPVPADAIVWLQGNGYDRGPKTLELFSARHAPVIVVSGNLRTHDPRTRPPRLVVTVADLATWLRTRGVPEAAILVEDQSLHTRDQAVHVLALAQQRGWHAILLVASPHHQLRAFLTFCKRAEEMRWVGRIVNQPAPMLWETIPNERDRAASELFREEYSKLQRYKAHIVTIATGLHHVDRTGTARQV